MRVIKSIIGVFDFIQFYTKIAKKKKLFQTMFGYIKFSLARKKRMKKKKNVLSVYFFV